MSEPYLLTLSQILPLIRHKKLSPVTLMESLLRRIDTIEPHLKAWVTLDRDGLRRISRRYQEELARGKSRGPLHGIPIAVKDIFYTAGMKTTAGSKIFENFIPDYDATAVARLKQAGAIILGKTATTEFAYHDPAPTVNPWNLQHTPGGSSSGSAAAVAAQMCPAALGTQTGGSILRPASYCGIVGLKPTYGRISCFGVFALSWSLDHVGVLTRSVKDAALLLEILAGKDPQDATTASLSVPAYARIGEASRKPHRMGLVRSFFEKKAEKNTWRKTLAVLSQLERAGAKIEEAKMPESFELVQDAHRTIMGVEAASYHERLFAAHRGAYRPRIRALIESGMEIPAVDYLRAQRMRATFCREMEKTWANFDCLITPATPAPAPAGLSSTGDPSFQNPWSFGGFPTIGLPSGLSPQGLPVGIQLIGPPFSEKKLCACARWCEKIIDFSTSPSLDLFLSS
jgi:aspartyl-tRNA(Asn)/glutamyl-tRNA(Gln) amidotransferase subunit A